VTEPGGTAIEAAVEGYLVAGKTGTAQKADYIHGGYAKDKWLASFIGFAPADKPAMVISVVIDEPIIAHYGGTVAGPVFRRIAEVALRHMGVAPDRGRTVLARMKEKPAAEPTTKPAPTEGIEKGQSRVPDVGRLPLRRAVVTLHAESLVPEVSGSGLVVRQDPAPGTVVSHGSTVRTFLAAAVPEGPHEP
jgi:cell division protein FtsI (penicillin-binding protein 3)